MGHMQELDCQIEQVGSIIGWTSKKSASVSWTAILMKYDIEADI